MNALFSNRLVGRLVLMGVLTTGFSIGLPHEPEQALIRFEWLSPAVAQPAAPTVGAAVGAVLKQASENLGAQKPGPAAAALKAALNTPGLTDFELFSIHRMLIGAEFGNQQFAQVIESGKLVMASPYLIDAEKPSVRQSMISASFKLSKFAEASLLAEDDLKLNPQDAGLLDLRLKSYYLAKNYAAAVHAAEDYLKLASGNKPSEDILKIYAHSASEIDSSSQYNAALMALVQHYPNPDYWSDLLYRKNASGVFQKVGEIQFYRLLQAANAFKDPGELIDAAELAIKAGFPLEANGYLDAGVQSGLLPKPELQKIYNDKRKQIAGLIQQDAAAPRTKSGKPKPPLASAAEAYNLVLQGQVDLGLELLQTALKQVQGRPEAGLIRLNYAVSLYKAGKREDAVREFTLLKSDSPELANLWLSVFNVK